MTITVQPQPKSQVQLTIELSPEEMKPYLEKAAEELSQEFKIEGFRPGKASLGIVIGKVGAQAVWESAADIAIRKTFIQAVRDKQLATIGQPHIHVLKLAPDNPFRYSAESAVLPTMTIGDYTNFKLAKTDVNITAAEVDKALEDLREMFATEAMVERAAQLGDKVVIDLTLSKDHVQVESGSSTNHPVVIGSKHFIPGFEEQLIGLKKDDQKTFSLKFPKEYHNDQLAGQTGEFAVNVKSVAEVTKPELNDEFAKKAGAFDNLLSLRIKLEENLRTEAEEREDSVFERAIVDELISRSKFGELPELLVNSELEKMMHELQEQVSQRGGKWEDYLKAIKKSPEDLKKEFTPQAQKRVKAALLIREIAKREHMVADPKLVEAELQSTRAMYQGNPDVEQRINSDDYRDYLKSLQVNKQVVERLKQNAKNTKTA